MQYFLFTLLVIDIVSIIFAEILSIFLQSQVELNTFIYFQTIQITQMLQDFTIIINYQYSDDTLKLRNNLRITLIFLVVIIIYQLGIQQYILNNNNDLQDSQSEKFLQIYIFISLFMFTVINILKIIDILISINNTKVTEEVNQRVKDYQTKTAQRQSNQDLSFLDKFKKPFISIMITQDDVKQYTNGSYINFLLILQTKVLLNAGQVSNKQFINDILLPNSEYLDAYIHYSCWTLGHLIIKNLMIKQAFLNEFDNKELINKDLLYSQNIQIEDEPEKESTITNLDIIDSISDLLLNQNVSSLYNLLLEFKQVEFMELIYGKKEELMLEISDYNMNYSKQSTINDSQLQKQVKKYIIANNKQKEQKRYKLQKKKLLQLAVEHIPGMIKIDCIEDPQIHQIEDQIENQSSKELKDKQIKIKSSASNNITLNNSGESINMNNI